MLDANTLVNRIVAAGIARLSDIEGCSIHDIDAIETLFNVKLPVAYRMFLQKVGRDGGGFWSDVDYTIDKLTRLNHEARDILVELESTKLELPVNSFVFSMRRGEQFMFFVCDNKSPDPPVYYYCIGFASFKKIAESIWDVLETELIELERIYKGPASHYPWMKRQ